MLNWLKSVWAKWKIHITVVGGAVIVATTFGDCSFTPNLDGDDAAEEGATDDLVMCLVIYSWLTDQNYFKELTDDDIRRRLFQSQQKMIEEDMAPFGFIDDGIEWVEEAPFTDVDGDYWTPHKLPGGQI